MKSPQNIQPSTRFAIRIFSLDRSTTTRASTRSAEIRASTGSAETRASIGSAETRAPTRSAVCCFRRIPVSLPTSLSVSSLWTCGFVASGSGLNFCIV
ncbi:hypothetical protein RchiOBHm_Chr2g0124901 [Rosa chinensis]|uniref:Uncharacterized protein n=1 Tax=Rosa chinensis TaxID=74649 RepID=A0A2P6RTG5_ROSCH|nr:hypothetical protein RchiOBHm_Chr2g0124901 [Rosa chinensis]